MLNPMIRTIENIVETNVIGVNGDNLKGKKLFQIVKYITGKNANSQYADYTIENVNNHYEFNSVVVHGKLGFIRVTLEHLFEAI